MMRHTPLALPRAALVVGLCLTGCSAGSTPSPDAQKPSTGSSSAQGSTLRIAGYAYDPMPVTVAAGSSVSVTNTDSAEHTVTADMAGLFVANDIGHGKTITFIAPKTAGTYTFHCEYHHGMHGTLVVT